MLLMFFFHTNKKPRHCLVINWIISRTTNFRLIRFENISRWQIERGSMISRFPSKSENTVGKGEIAVHIVSKSYFPRDYQDYREVKDYILYTL